MALNDSQINKMVTWLRQQTKKHNHDNISRTEAYLKFYQQNPEIKWALLASAVSRNAGYHITLLQSTMFQSLLSTQIRVNFTLFFERANWLIFEDAYPQLLLYQLSKKYDAPLFSLLTNFQVSSYIRQEWFHFWEKKDEGRLMVAQIINEQTHLEHQLIQTNFAQAYILNSAPFILEDHAHLSYVLLPTLKKRIYGVTVSDFKKVEQRIKIGQELAHILFHPLCYGDIYAFLRKTTHTGSRNDYERLCEKWKSEQQTPLLRLALPSFTHEQQSYVSWDLTRKQIKKYTKPHHDQVPKERTTWLKWKQKEWAPIQIALKAKNRR
ncbi:DUF2515 family protein [Alkalihalobacillus pseudalcaliphilus]|uniref:DUF2515 family protein n=1 Tax=Alkalihalobacillus pseudalcaliphilus TaxID=79884 RepID=UPI00064DC15D|nr:DUF2515 family protein [Alkalihalobacillus pseudalcaliphilus]KMK76399.1 hypothetical protein AB990_14505 [Alkalihalobacillus pseudalcaliphilus]